MAWESVIGLEIHVQLSTQSKIFSSSSTRFGQEQNTQASVIDLGLPGVLPVLNKEVVHKAIQFGLAIDAEISRHTIFARKNYFYPDLPKGYQISQLDDPIVGKGTVSIQTGNGPKEIGITRAHLEEDAGKSIHDEYPDDTAIDLNRAGTPLLEIVSEPDMRNAKEAIAYLKLIHSLVRYIGISDGNMAEGSFRCDANISIRPQGSEQLGTRTELKNINSFKFVEKAINLEIQRQIDLVEDGGKVKQETRLYDANKHETRSMRSKEEANDYRYFPDPDLLPLTIEDAQIDAIRESLPELPLAKQKRFSEEYQLGEADAAQIAQDKACSDFFENACGKLTNKTDAKLVANWINGEISARLNKEELAFESASIKAEQLANLIDRISDQSISNKIAKQVFDIMWESDSSPSADSIIEEKGLKQVSDTGALEKMVDEVIANNPEQVANYRQAEEKKRGKMLGFFVGQIMKASQGQANPQQLNQILKQKLEQK
jgi:aspartyl-tRNA(Asn)/glutamyl-tRNA(Gln) amidotransferase subunit B